MSDFSYEYGCKNAVLEKYEWDNIWFESTEIVDARRLIYIGDSISCATRRVATAVAQGAMLVDGLGTSKSLDNPYFFDTIRLFAQQQGTRAAILFNNGLHGWHLNDETEYKARYREMLQFLLKEFEATPVFLVLTTAVADAERNKRVIVRNNVVLELADEYDLPVIDLYSLTDAHRDLLSADGVHLTAQGYEMLANKIVKAVSENLNIMGE